MTSNNPIPFSAETMTVSDIKKAVETLRDLFETVERTTQGNDDNLDIEQLEGIAYSVISAREFWQKKVDRRPRGL